jgi:hypothetical protein
MTKSNQQKEQLVSLLHQKLRSKIYRFSEKHGITTFEALGILLYLATEISADALVTDGVLKGGVDPDRQDDDADEPVSAQQEIDDLNARIKELLGENEILDKGLNKMTQAAETLRQENMRLRVRIGETGPAPLIGGAQ